MTNETSNAPDSAPHVMTWLENIEIIWNKESQQAGR